MMRIVTDGVFPAAGDSAVSANILADRLYSRSPSFFDSDGNRIGGTGEYIVELRPKKDDAPATLNVYTRNDRSDWIPVDRLQLPAGAKRKGAEE
jgi:hypothetical protein